jgi:hypothetical protein
MRWLQAAKINRLQSKSGRLIQLRPMLLTAPELMSEIGDFSF